jgi:hypothetical protein
MEAFFNTVDNTHRDIEGVLSKAESVMIPFLQKFEQEPIAVVPVKKHYKILGVWIDSRRRFSFNSAQVLMTSRRASRWIQTYRYVFNFQQRKQTYVSLAQSLMDYHLLPTWPRMTKKAQMERKLIK